MADLKGVKIMNKIFDINYLMKGIMREKYFYIPIECLEKIKSILDKKMKDGKIKHYGWCYHNNKGMYLVGLTEYYYLNSSVPLAA